MPHSASNKLRLAWFSPLNLPGSDSPSLSAYASELLLPLLAKDFEIELFHNSFAAHPDFPTHHYVTAYAVDRAQPFDIIFYQLEDSRQSNFVRVHLGQMPGLLWFHDIIFTSFGPEPILNSPWQYAVQKFFNRQLAWPERGEELEQFGPFGFRESAWAWRAAFSNPASHAEYRRSAKTRLSSNGVAEQSVCIPLPIAEDLPTKQHHSQVLSVGFCGSPRIEHRAHKLLQALSGFQSPYRLKWLVAETELEHARNLLAEFSIEAVELVSARTPKMWQSMLSGLDVAVHLLFSVYGQPDPYLSMSMASNLPCLLTSFGAPDYIPASLVHKIEPGAEEANQIKAALQEIAAGGRSDAQASNFARERALASVVAQELKALFYDSVERFARFRKEWALYAQQAQQDLVQEALGLCVNESAILNPQTRVLKPAMREFGWLE